MVKHLTSEDRDQIADLVQRNLGPTEIALRLNRHHSVIARELQRNKADDGRYYATAAHQKAVTRRQERPLVRKMDRPEIRSAVQRGLHHDWSPDQINGRMRQQFPDDPTQRVSATTIYTWLHDDPHRHQVNRGFRAVLVPIDLFADIILRTQHLGP